MFICEQTIGSAASKSDTVRWKIFLPAHSCDFDGYTHSVNLPQLADIDIMLLKSRLVCCNEKGEYMSTAVSSEIRNVPAPRTYRVEDVAAILSVSRTSAYRLIKEGHFKTVRIGNAIRVSKKSFDEWLDAQTF